MYYIIDNQIVELEIEPSKEFYNHIQLTQEQTDFYELNHCSLAEVLALKLYEIYVPTLDELKLNKIQYFSQLAFEKRELIIPEYKIMNASLGIYDETETLKIKNIVQSFRTEFYRLKGLCENAKTIEELDNIMENYNE